MACDYPFPTCPCCVFNAFHIPVFFKANISHRPSLFPFSCSAYQTSDSGSSTGYVYRMAVEHSLPRRRRSGRSFPGDGVSWHVTILSLHVPAVYSMRFTFQCFLRPTFHIVVLSLFPCSCSAYQTSDSGSSTGYVYRMPVEHSLQRRRRSGRSFPGDGVSWHVTLYILSLHVPAVFSIRFTFQCFLSPTFHIVLLSSHAAVVPTRLLIAAPALGTFTGWRWSILYSGDEVAEDRCLETV